MFAEVITSITPMITLLQLQKGSFPPGFTLNTKNFEIKFRNLSIKQRIESPNPKHQRNVLSKTLNFDIIKINRLVYRMEKQSLLRVAILCIHFCNFKLCI